MKIPFGCDKEFDSLWDRLEKKYPQDIFEMDGVGSQLDTCCFSKKFFTNNTTTADISIDSNANVSDKGVTAYSIEMGKPLEKLNSYYMMWKLAKKMFGVRTANHIVESSVNGDIYINDFYGFGAGKPYCFNYSCYDIATRGLPMVDKIKSLPPKYLYAFKSQVEQFVTVASNATLGATGLADLLLVMSFYVEDILERCGDAHFKFASEEDCWTYIRETIVSMIYTINQPMRANQSPFTNISLFDDIFLRKLQSDYLHPTKATPLNLEIVRKLQELFIDIMNHELDRTPITFPVVSACFARDNNFVIKDENFLEMVADKNRKYGFLNIYIGKSSTLSSCCRLRSDLDNDYFNSFGAGSSKIGSLGVATINCARLGFKFKDDVESMKKEFKRLVSLCFMINYIKRTLISERIEGGYHSLYSYGFIDINRQYSTLGINGFNELICLSGYDPLSDDGVEFGLSVIKIANRLNNSLGRKYNVPVNIEQIPAENTSVKLADKDKVLGYNNGEYDFYSNQFIPLTVNADILDRMRLQGVYDEHFSGGSIFHANFENRIYDKERIKDMVKVCAKLGIVYFAFNYVLQRCEQDHMTVGRKDTCECGADITENFTRVVGFLTTTKNWHRVRREKDFPERKFYA